ncbi:MAG TPA: HAD family hydrolase [Balneolales bacterium]|nr:HAD family hydrolase [Balneolales bacterium]
MIYSGIKVIGFDADDTLWVNEPIFRQIEDRFISLVRDYDTTGESANELFKTEMKNLTSYGYGIKGFVLSMIETALRISGGMVPQSVIADVIDLGKEMLNHPIELLDGVVTTLEKLKPDYRLIVVTKGDLLDQERKLRKSGIEHYFHHTEVVSDKTEENYANLLTHFDIDPGEFLMVGNSVKSDILPILNIGSNAVHVPYHTTWQHEMVDTNGIDQKNPYHTIDRITDLVDLLE